MKLTDLTPEGFGQLVEKRCLERIKSVRARWSLDADWLGRVAFKLTPGYQVIVRKPSLAVSERQGNTDLALTAQSLCTYAQRGVGFNVKTDAAIQAEAAADALGELLLCFDPFDSSARSLPEEWEREQESDDPIAVVARASLARIALARGDDVQRSWLAALLGVTPQRIRTLIAEGVLAAKPVERGGEERALSPITHASASQWLRARDPSRT